MRATIYEDHCAPFGFTPSFSIVGEKAPIVGEKAPIVGEKAPIGWEKAPIGWEQAPIAWEKGSNRVGEGSEQSLAFLQSSAVTAGAVVDGITDFALALGIDESRFQPTPLDVMLRSAMAKLASQIRDSDAEVSRTG